MPEPKDSKSDIAYPFLGGMVLIAFGLLVFFFLQESAGLEALCAGVVLWCIGVFSLFRKVMSR